MILTELNIELYAAKGYENPNCVSIEEFVEDFNRLRYIKRLIRRYSQNGELKERLILNHLVILYNTFDNDTCTRLLFFKLKKYLEYITPFLLLLNRLPKTVLDENNNIIYTSDIKMNQYIVDIFLVYQFIKRLATPFNETKAFKLGLIDEKGKRLKKASSKDEKNAMTYFDRLIFNLKRVLSKVTGIESKFTTFAAALFLLKESNKPKDKRIQYVTESILHDFKRENKELIKSLLLTEEMPANNVGSGNIAGAGDGEDPPMRKRVIDRYKRKNKAQANTVGRKSYNAIRTA